VVGWNGTGKEIQDIYVVPDEQGRGPADEPPIAYVFAEFLRQEERWDRISILRTADGEKLAITAMSGTPAGVPDPEIAADLIERTATGRRHQHVNLPDQAMRSCRYAKRR
jgi:hypothetical protein